MKVYVDEMPKRCKDCPCMNNDGYGGYDCNLYYKQNDEILSCEPYDNKIPNECPLKTIQSVQNEKAVEALEKLKSFMYNYIDKNDDFYKLQKEIDNVIKEYEGENDVYNT